MPAIREVFTVQLSHTLPTSTSPFSLNLAQRLDMTQLLKKDLKRLLRVETWSYGLKCITAFSLVNSSCRSRSNQREAGMRSSCHSTQKKRPPATLAAGGRGPTSCISNQPCPLKMKLRFPRCHVMWSKPSSVVSTLKFWPHFHTLYVSLGQILETRGTAKEAQRERQREREAVLHSGTLLLQGTAAPNSFQVLLGPRC